MSATETAIQFGPDQSLFGVHHPADGNTVVVFCPPFAEEKKCSYRTFVDTARALAEAGIPSLRFDYYGTGDSAGHFSDFSPTRAIDDIVAAAAKARELSWADLPDAASGRAGNVVLLGLRLGATLALAAAPKAAVTSLVLWQPVVSGKGFFDLTIKRQMLRKQLIGGAGECSCDRPGGHSNSDVIDLDGFPLSRAAGEEIRELGAIPAAQAFDGDIRLLQISHSETMSRELEPLMDAAFHATTFAAVVCPPFWNRIGRADAGPVINQTVSWLQ
jgi:hypothetical protein